LAATTVTAANVSVAAEYLSQQLSVSASFPREARLLDAAGYGRVFKRNNNSDSNALEPGRLGLAIAKKRAKRAVDRNRIKRVARESFRHNRALLVGYDAVVMNKDHASSASRVELRQSLDTLWQELTRKPE